jgi:hypothetical protein
MAESPALAVSLKPRVPLLVMIAFAAVDAPEKETEPELVMVAFAAVAVPPKETEPELVILAFAAVESKNDREPQRELAQLTLKMALPAPAPEMKRTLPKGLRKVGALAELLTMPPPRNTSCEVMPKEPKLGLNVYAGASGVNTNATTLAPASALMKISVHLEGPKVANPPGTTAGSQLLMTEKEELDASARHVASCDRAAVGANVAVHRHAAARRARRGISPDRSFIAAPSNLVESGCNSQRDCSLTRSNAWRVIFFIFFRTASLRLAHAGAFICAS